MKTGGDRDGAPHTLSSVVALILISVAATLVAALFLLVASFLICERASKRNAFSLRN